MTLTRSFLMKKVANATKITYASTITRLYLSMTSYKKLFIVETKHSKRNQTVLHQPM